MTWSTRLENQAKAHANNMAARESLYHSQLNGDGENVAMQTGAQPTAADVTAAWYTELEYMKWDSNGEPLINQGGVTGHLTQEVWKDSKELGCAMAQSASGKWYSACQYHPAGNFNMSNPGVLKANVPAPSKSKAQCPGARFDCKRPGNLNLADGSTSDCDYWSRTISKCDWGQLSTVSSCSLGCQGGHAHGDIWPNGSMTCQCNDGRTSCSWSG